MSPLTLVLLSACVPAAVGVALALLRTGRWTRWAVYALLFSLSIGLTYGPEILQEEGNRFAFLLDGIVHTGCLSFVVHVLPAIVLHWVTNRVTRQRASIHPPTAG